MADASVSKTDEGNLVRVRLPLSAPGQIRSEPTAHPGMHTTDSIDYGLCVEGEMYLELDGGKEVHLTPGTCVVQRGTRHAWHNRSDKAALMMHVLVGATRDS